MRWDVPYCPRSSRDLKQKPKYFSASRLRNIATKLQTVPKFCPVGREVVKDDIELVPLLEPVPEGLRLYGHLVGRLLGQCVERTPRKTDPHEVYVVFLESGNVTNIWRKNAGEILQSLTKQVSYVGSIANMVQIGENHMADHTVHDKLR